MRASFTIAAILAAVTFAADAELGRRSYRPQTSSYRQPQRKSSYPARAPPRSYGTSTSRPLSATKADPESSRYSLKSLMRLQAQLVPKANPQTRSRPSLQKYGSQTDRGDSKTSYTKQTSTPAKEETLSSYAAKSKSPQPAKKLSTTPNYDTKKIDLHKLAEQVETNTLLQQSLQMKVSELQADKEAL